MNRMLIATQRDLCAVMLLTIHLPWDYKDWQRQKGHRCFTKPHFTHVLCSLIKKKTKKSWAATNFTNPTSYLCFDFAYASSAFDLLLLLICCDKLWFLFEFFSFLSLFFLLFYSYPHSYYSHWTHDIYVWWDVNSGSVASFSFVRYTYVVYVNPYPYHFHQRKLISFSFIPARWMCLVNTVYSTLTL